MAARRARREGESSLFPFLSVLACLIGTLTLLIAALAIGQVAESLADREPDPSQAQQLEAQRAELRALQARVEDAGRVKEELTAAQAEMRALGVRPDQSDADRRHAVGLRRSAAQLAQELRELEEKSKNLDGSILGVQADLVRASPKDDDRPIRILPQGHGEPLRPFFVECRREGVRVYREDLSHSFYLARDSIDDQERFRAFLQRVRSQRDATVIFLIRPDGVKTYAWASSQSGRLYVRNAKLPLPSQGEIRFAL